MTGSKHFKLFDGEVIGHNYLPSISYDPTSHFDNHVQFHIREGQYQAAGYLLMYGHMSKAYSEKVMTPIADANWRKSLLNSQRFEPIEKELGDTYWSGPTNFDKRRMYQNKVIKADLNAAYSNYLLTVKKPGVIKHKYHGFYPLGNDQIVAYKCRFRCRRNSQFADWFVVKTEPLAKTKNVKFFGDWILGEILIFASKDMPLLDYALQMEKLTIELSYVYSGEELRTDLKNVRNLVIEKNRLRNPIAKQIVNSSMGWRSKLDKSSFYHMVQHTKFVLLDFAWKNEIMDYIIGVATDCLVIQVTKDNEAKMLEGPDSILAKLRQYVPPNEWYSEGVALGCGRFTAEVIETDKLDGRFKRRKHEIRTSK